ncbi:MAG TPA: hypothetical protein VF329_03430 [Gammaproteobacteria bacterium]
MGKTFKKIATIVGIAALGFFTFGVGTLVAGGAGLVAAVTTPFLAGGAISLGLIAQAGLGLIAIGSMPDKPKSLEDTGANSRGRAFADPNALGVFAFGETTLPEALLHDRKENHLGT